jgi:hypothetical protein
MLPDRRLKKIAKVGVEGSNPFARSRLKRNYTMLEACLILPVGLTEFTEPGRNQAKIKFMTWRLAVGAVCAGSCRGESMSRPAIVYLTIDLTYTSSAPSRLGWERAHTNLTGVTQDGAPSLDRAWEVGSITCSGAVRITVGADGCRMGLALCRTTASRDHWTQ